MLLCEILPYWFKNSKVLEWPILYFDLRKSLTNKIMKRIIFTGGNGRFASEFKKKKNKFKVYYPSKKQQIF